MMTGIRNILWLLPFVLLVSAPVWWSPVTAFLAPRGDLGATPAEQSVPEKSFVMEEVFFTQRRNGAVEWSIVTDRLFADDVNSEKNMEKVAADLYDGESVKFHITSKKGLYDPEKQMLTLSGDVVVVSQDGFAIRSPLLKYDDRSRMIKTTSSVHITGKNMSVAGKGLDYNMKTGSYKIGGRLKFTAW